MCGRVLPVASNLPYMKKSHVASAAKGTLGRRQRSAGCRRSAVPTSTVPSAQPCARDDSQYDVGFTVEPMAVVGGPQDRIPDVILAERVTAVVDDGASLTTDEARSNADKVIAGFLSFVVLALVAAMAFDGDVIIDHLATMMVVEGGVE